MVCFIKAPLPKAYIILFSLIKQDRMIVNCLKRITFVF
jgi:hypothetical protein